MCKLTSLVERVFTFNIVVWYGNLGVKGKAKLARIVRMAGKITGSEQDSLSNLYLTAVERKTAQILDDAKHPLFSVSETPVGPKIPSANCQEECVQKINKNNRWFYPKCYFCLKF